MCVGGGVDLAQQSAAADRGLARIRVYVDLLQAREVDHQPVVDAAEAAAVVPSGADGDVEAVLAAERDCSDDVLDVGAARDQGRALVDHSVVERPNLVVVRVIGSRDTAVQLCLEGVDALTVQHLGHLLLLS